MTWQTLFLVTSVRTINATTASFGITYAGLRLKMCHINMCSLTSCTIKLIYGTATYFIGTTWTIFPTVTPFARIYTFCFLIKVWDVGVYFWASNATKRTIYFGKDILMNWYRWIEILMLNIKLSDMIMLTFWWWCSRWRNLDKK